MRVRILLLGLLVPFFASAETFHRENGATSVVLAPICVPGITGQGWATVDFNTTSLVITAIASGDGAYTAFNYTAGDIDDGPADFSWGTPAVAAVEIDAIATGAFAGCISLSLRDEVFAVAGSDKWTVAFTDGESALMDHEVQVLSPATAAALATAQSGQNAIRRAIAQNDTTIAAFTDGTGTIQTSFTLTAGSADNRAYNGCDIMITDQATATQIAIGNVLSYTGATKTVLLRFDPAVFTMAVGDLATITCPGR